MLGSAHIKASKGSHSFQLQIYEGDYQKQGYNFSTLILKVLQQVPALTIVLKLKLFSIHLLFDRYFN